MKTKVQTRKNKRNYLIIALIVVLLLLAVGYASFSQQLTITGTAKGEATWDVEFSSDSTGNVSSDGHTLTINTDTLQYPGDQELITVIIENKSSVGIKLTEFNLEGPDPSSGIKITKLDLPTAEGSEEKIAANNKCTYKYVIEWDKESTATRVDGTYTFTFKYEQDTTLEKLEPTHDSHASI